MTQAKKAPTILYRVQLEDEIPVIGSGHRWVFAREGKKWAFILCPFSVNTVKLQLSVWQGIKKDRWKKEKFIRKYLRARLALLGRAPTSFELSALDTEGGSG